MSSLRLALKQSLQESAANQPNDGGSDAAGGVSSSGNDSTSDDDDDNTRRRQQYKHVSATHHSAANKIQSKWKKHETTKLKHGAAFIAHHHDKASGEVAALAYGHQQQQSAAAAGASGTGGQSEPPPLRKKMKKKARNKNDDESAKQATTVPYPSAETMELQRTIMTTRKARKHVTPGLRVKVRFATTETKKKRWFGGRVSAVSKEGSKIRIKYDDGTTEVTRFPDKDVIVDDVGNGQHSVSADKFIPRSVLREENDDDDEHEFDIDDHHHAAEDAQQDYDTDAKPRAKSPLRPSMMKQVVQQSLEDDASSKAGRHTPTRQLKTVPYKGPGAGFLTGNKDDGHDVEVPVKRKRGRPPKHRPTPTGPEPPKAATLLADATQLSPPTQMASSPRRLPQSSKKSQPVFDFDDTGLKTALNQAIPAPSISETHEHQIEAEKLSPPGNSQVPDESVGSSVEHGRHYVCPGSEEMTIPAPVDSAPLATGSAQTAHVERVEREPLSPTIHTSDFDASIPVEDNPIVQNEVCAPNHEQLPITASDIALIAEQRPVDVELERATHGAHRERDNDDGPAKQLPHTTEGKVLLSSPLPETLKEVENPVRRFHIHIPAHKLNHHGAAHVEPSAEQETKPPSESAAGSSSANTTEGVDGTVSGSDPASRSEASDSCDVAMDADLAVRKRKRSDVESPDDAEVEHIVAKGKQAKEVHEVSTVDKLHRDEANGLQADGKIALVDGEEGLVDRPMELMKERLKIQITLTDRSDTMEYASKESATPRSRLTQLERLGAFDASIVRSGRRAAQQANERITSRQELIIDSPDGKSNKKKRQRESDDNSETSDDDSQWVQCDMCSKWRIIPSIVVSSLPKQWYCSDNLWDQKRASCDAPEQTSKQVAKEKKRRKKLQQRIQASAATATVTGGNADDEAPQSTPVFEAPVDDYKRASPDDLLEDTERLEGDKKEFSLTGKKVRPDSETLAIVDGFSADIQGRRGRGRPRRIKEVLKPSGDADFVSRSQSIAGATDETDNLEWVQCERCSKWRKLPAHVSADDLPDVWYCSMNTWNTVSANCDAPEDKADGLQDIGFHSGAGSNKLSYRNLIFGNNGRKPNRPVSERARAAESLFLAPNDDEDAPPVVLYANSSAFVVRKKGNPALVSDEKGGMSVLELMSHSNLWAELQAAAMPFVQLSSAEKPNKLISYTYDTLPRGVNIAVKELLLHLIGDKGLTSEEIVLAAHDGASSSESDVWSNARLFCDVNVVVTSLFELVKEGIIECIQGKGLKDWNPRYRLTRHRQENAAVVAVVDEAEESSVQAHRAPQAASRCMKISKPWKRQFQL